MNTTAQIIIFGVLSGMRSMSAPAFLAAHIRKKQPGTLRGSALRHLGSPLVSAALALMAGGELVADKLPSIPARIDPAPLSGRMMSGAFVGAVISRMRRRSMASGALLGAASAAAGSFAAYHARRALTEDGGLPDPLAAVAEDALALAIGKTVSERM